MTSDEEVSELRVHHLTQTGLILRTELLAGLDLSRFARFCVGELGTTSPFTGIGSVGLNIAERFFDDGVGAIRAGALVIPNPLAPGDIATSDVLVSPATPWDTVPIYAYRYSTTEVFYFLKRGLSWCTDIGLYFPRRRLLVSFQQNDARFASDCTDLQHAFKFFGTNQSAVGAGLASVHSQSLPCVIVNSDHFAHHIWNELSVVEGLVAEGLHERVRLVVNRRPLAPLSQLFPEIPKELILNTEGPTQAPLLLAMEQGWFVAPVGRKFIPQGLIDRILRCAEDHFPAVPELAAAFSAAHDPVLWITIRVDARTATNLVDALVTVISALLRRFPAMGVIFDGYTLASSQAPGDWSRGLTDSETSAIEQIVARVGVPFDHTVLCGRHTMEAFLWAQAADFYICPYGTAQHKVAWMNPVPGIIHVGANKSRAAEAAPLHARQRGETPTLFYGTVTRADNQGNDFRKDLFSYELDVDAFAAAVEGAVATLPPRVGRSNA